MKIITTFSNYLEKRKEYHEWLKERDLMHKKNSPITGTLLKRQFEKQRS